CWRVRTKHARTAPSDFKSLPLPKWRVPSEAVADANQGAVAAVADANQGAVAAVADANQGAVARVRLLTPTRVRLLLRLLTPTRVRLLRLLGCGC
ncbi:MAG: hypothetical protein OEN21_08525, partial [Myxococcales bacterium]|nr:hypothetical protein [Myxococcales bacterium]